MAFEIKQNLRAIQRLSLSTELKNSITILALGRYELENYISEELEKNPCLVGARKNTTSRIKSADSSTFNQGKEIADNLEKYSLHHHILQQILLMRLSSYEVECVKIIIQYIDDSGYLNSTVQEISNVHEIYEDDIKYALELIQKCDPPGIGCHNLQECLTLQLRRLNNIPLYVETILKNHWSDFEKQNLAKISKSLKANPEEIKTALRFIRDHLDPKPARQFGEDQNQIIVPDVYVFKRDGEWMCSLNQNGLPRIKLSKHYENLMKELKDAAEQKEAVKYLNENIRSAKWLIRSLEERNKTILKVTEMIIKSQKDFFEKGVDYLTPLTLKDVAYELDLHESTISRSTLGKYLHSPKGIFELKYFFNAKIETDSGKELANESIKQWVMELIKNENKEHPLSDQDIADKIQAEKNLKIARRTVTKYRESLGILSSSKRSKRF